jgi:hypothetical protein
VLDDPRMPLDFIKWNALLGVKDKKLFKLAKAIPI